MQTIENTYCICEDDGALSSDWFLYQPSGINSVPYTRTGKIRFSGTQKSVLLKANSGEHCAPRNFVLLVLLADTCVCLILHLTVYQVKWLWKDIRGTKVRYNCIQHNVIDMERDIKKHWRSSGVFIINCEKTTHLFLVFHCWIWESVAGFIYRQRSKYRKVKIRKYASTGTNYAILARWVKRKSININLYQI